MNRYSLVAIALLALVTTTQAGYLSPVIFEKQVPVEKSLWFSDAKELEVKLSNPEVAAAYARRMNVYTDMQVVCKNVAIGFYSGLGVVAATLFIGKCYEWIQNQKRNTVYHAVQIEQDKNRLAAEKAKRELYIKHAQEEAQAYHIQRMIRTQQETADIKPYAENNVAYDKGWKEQQIARAAAEVEALKNKTKTDSNTSTPDFMILDCYSTNPSVYVSTTTPTNQAAVAA